MQTTPPRRRLSFAPRGQGFSPVIKAAREELRAMHRVAAEFANRGKIYMFLFIAYFVCSGCVRENRLKQFLFICFSTVVKKRVQTWFDP